MNFTTPLSSECTADSVYTVASYTKSPDGNTLATADDRMVRLWNAHTGEHIRTFTGHTDGVLSVLFSPDGNTLASGAWGQDDPPMERTHKRTHPHPHRAYGIGSIACHSVRMVTPSQVGSHDGTIRLWNARTGGHIHTITEHTKEVYSVSFSPDGNTLASGSHDGTIRLWNARTGGHIHTITRDRFIVLSVLFSPDGNTLASGNGNIDLWNVHTGELIQTLRGGGDACVVQSRMATLSQLGMIPWFAYGTYTRGKHTLSQRAYG